MENKNIDNLNMSLADRMKYYESLYNNTFEYNKFYLIRLDGNGFSKRIKKWKLNKPFDNNFHWAMVDTCKELLKLIPNARLIWTASDEITVLCMTANKSDAWFANRINKVVSLSASFATAYFNKFMNDSVINVNEFPGFFDARIISIPSFDEAVNNILSRYNDAKRNSISMWADSVYSHKELLNKNSDEKLNMLKDKGIDWNDNIKVPAWTKYGTFIFKEFVAYKTDTKVEAATKEKAEQIANDYPDKYFLRTKIKSIDLEEITGKNLNNKIMSLIF